MSKQVYVGVDVGSATVKVIGVTKEGEMQGKPIYLRHDQFPTQVAAVKFALKEYLKSVDKSPVAGIGITGSGRELNKQIVGGDLIRTEIFAHAVGIKHLINRRAVFSMKNGKKEALKTVGTIIEIGGQDSKVIIFDSANTPVYFNMNTICSAGTGEFLKQIADEAGVPLEQFGKKSLAAKQSARIDSTCTVFSRRDFRHLTQKGVPLEERLAGVCDALVANYLNNVVSGQSLPRPIIFQGGVAFNEGVKAAFTRRLGEEVIIPPHHDIIGALGMAIIVMEEKLNKNSNNTSFKADFFEKEFSSQIKYCHGCQNACELSQPIEKQADGYQILDTIGGRCEGSFLAKNQKAEPQEYGAARVPIDRQSISDFAVTEFSQELTKVGALKSDRHLTISPEPAHQNRLRSAKGIYFAGIDGGSRGTKYSLIKEEGNGSINIVTTGSLDTAGDAIQAILLALIAIERKLPSGQKLGGIGTTGSAGELARDIIAGKTKETSDIKVTEILAHATWAKHMVPDVKVIMDIGGNDAKIILLHEHGIEFAMNDKCAAGAGAFIEAIAKRFEVPLGSFGEIALQSQSPARISGRCAVFGESDIIHKARAGFPTKDLFLGLAYSLCRTYLSDIGKGKHLRVPIVAQGGTFLNTAVQEAFKKTLQVQDDEFIIAKDPQLVVGAGALGAALLAKQAYENGKNSSFKGFDKVLSSYYRTNTLTCTHADCERSCKGMVTLLENEQPIAGYKSINCDLGLFTGMLEDPVLKEHVSAILERG